MGSMSEQMMEFYENNPDQNIEKRTDGVNKKKRVLSPQAIRNRLATWKQKDVLHQEELRLIQFDCGHREMKRTGLVCGARDQSDNVVYMAEHTCIDCGLKMDKEI